MTTAVYCPKTATVVLNHACRLRAEPARKRSENSFEPVGRSTRAPHPLVLFLMSILLASRKRFALGEREMERFREMIIPAIASALSIVREIIDGFPAPSP